MGSRWIGLIRANSNVNVMTTTATSAPTCRRLLPRSSSFGANRTPAQVNVIKAVIRFPRFKTKEGWVPAPPVFTSKLYFGMAISLH
jgi:hypothetical protein